MKYIKQFFNYSFNFFYRRTDELLHSVARAGKHLRHDNPFLCLSTGIIKLSDVKDAGKFLIEIMPLMFIPAGVGLIDSWGVLKPLLLPVTVITAASLVLVFGVSGRVAQRVIRHGEKKKAGAEDE